MAPDGVISTVDPEARHTRRSTFTPNDGFGGHVSAEPETGLITDAELTSAAGDAGSDAVVGQAMITRDRFHRPGARTEHPDAGGDVARPGEPQPDRPGGGEAVLAEPGSGGAAAAAGGDGGEITTAGTDCAEATAAAGEKGAGLRV